MVRRSVGMPREQKCGAAAVSAGLMCGEGWALESLKAGCAATKEPPVTFLSSRACAVVTLGEAGQLR